MLMIMADCYNWCVCEDQNSNSTVRTFWLELNFRGLFMGEDLVLRLEFGFIDPRPAGGTRGSMD